MSTPSAFELGRAIGGNVSGGVRQAGEMNAIDQILQQANESGDPSTIQNVMGQLLQRVAPERQQMAMQVLQNKQAQLQNVKSQKSYNTLADAIEKENPNSSLHRTLGAIYRSDLPIDNKEKLIKSITSTVPYRAEQQQRLALDSVLKRYNSRIKEIDSELKTARIKDRPALEQQKKRMQRERDDLLNFQSLDSQENKPQEKIKFDANNPEHIQIFDQLDQEFNGDKVKINAALNERFTL